MQFLRIAYRFIPSKLFVMIHSQPSNYYKMSTMLRLSSSAHSALLRLYCSSHKPSTEIIDNLFSEEENKTLLHRLNSMTEEEIEEHPALGKVLKSAVLHRRPLSQISQLMTPGIDAVKLKRMCSGLLKRSSKSRTFRGADPLPSLEEAWNIKTIATIGFRTQSFWLKMGDDLEYLNYGTFSELPKITVHYDHVAYVEAARRLIDELPPADIYVLDAVNQKLFKKFPTLFALQLLQATFISMLKTLRPEQKLTILRPKFVMDYYLKKLSPTENTLVLSYVSQVLENGSIKGIRINNSRSLLAVMESLEYKQKEVVTFMFLANILYTLEILHKTRGMHMKPAVNK